MSEWRSDIEIGKGCGTVLVWAPLDGVASEGLGHQIAWYEDGDWMTSERTIWPPPTHWMPLPAPPKP